MANLTPPPYISLLNLTRKPKLTYNRDVHDDSITITVSNGTKSQTFTSPKSILMRLSGYFAIALSGRWETNNDSHMSLEDDPYIFHLFLRYLHEGHLSVELDDPVIAEYTKLPCTAVWPIRLLGKDAYDALKEKEVNVNDRTQKIVDIQSHFFIIELYTFADRRDIPRLSTLATTLLVNKILLSTLRLPVPILHTLLDETAGGKASPLFILLVDISARYVSDAYFGEFADELPVEFVVAVLKRQRELGGEEARRIEEEWREREDDWRNGFHWVEWVA
jgi:hypothetical protein